MIHHIFKIIMLMLLVKNIRSRAAGCKGQGRKRHYFFICYALSHSVLLLLESIWSVPQALHLAVLLTLYMSNLKQCYVSRRLFKMFLKLWLETLKGVMIYKYPAMEVVCLALMLVSTKLMGVFALVRFELFRLSRLFHAAVKNLSNRRGSAN